MSWTHDQLTPVDSLLFHSDQVKLGHFQCAADNQYFSVTESLNNDVFVFVRNPLWFRRNQGNFQFVGPGAILLHRAGTCVERRQAGICGDDAYWFGLRPDIFLGLLQRYGLNETEMGDALVATPRLRYQIAMLVTDIEAGHIERRDIETHVLQLLMQICHARVSRKTVGRSDRHRLVADRARAFLDNRLSETVTVRDVAAAADTTPFHLCRVFKEQVGMTVHSYKTCQRLGQVVDCMATGDSADLTKLAHAAGFSSHSHLCRVFQRYLGLPPSQFRRGGVSSRPSS